VPDPKEHAQHRGAIESVLRYIPGFRGYLEKEYRREADKLMRTYLADRLQRAKRGLDEFARRLANAAQIDALPECDRLRGRIDRLIGRLTGAVRGYSAFFEFVQVDEDALDDVYEHDRAMSAAVDALARQLDDMPAETEATAVLSKLIAQVEAIDTQLDAREDLLTGLASR